MDRSAEQILDEFLVVQAQGGSRAAFGQLVERWTPRLRRHAGRLLGHPDLAADAVQDAWLSVAKGLHGLDDPARFAAWTFGITTRRCIDLLRRRVRDRLLTANLEPPATTWPSQASDDQLDLTAAIRRLPLDQRLMVSLFYGEDQSVEAIAQAHGLPVGTVKSRLSAARDALKSILQGASQ